MRTLLALLIYALLTATLAVPGAANEPKIPPLESTGNAVCDHIRALQIPYLDHPGFDAECPNIVPFFRSYRDQLHALFVVACESGFDPEANERRWGHLEGGKPQRLWAFMTHLDWPGRLGFGWVDMTTTPGESFMASILVYDTMNNWYHWWSCHRNFNRYLPRFGIPQVWHCPSPSYWDDVPAGSNFTCGGITYGSG